MGLEVCIFLKHPEISIAFLTCPEANSIMFDRLRQAEALAVLARRLYGPHVMSSQAVTKSLAAWRKVLDSSAHGSPLPAMDRCSLFLYSQCRNRPKEFSLFLALLLRCSIANYSLPRGRNAIGRFSCAPIELNLLQLAHS